MQAFVEKLKSFEGAYHIIGVDGALVHVSRKWSQLMGYTHQEVVGTPSLAFVSSDSLARAKEGIIKVMQTGYVREVPAKFITSKGVPLHCLISSTVLLNDREQAIGALGVLMPVTEQTFHNRLAQKAEPRTLNASIGFDAELIIGPSGKIEFINAPAEFLTGWSFSDALGKRLKRVYTSIYNHTQTLCEPPALTVLRTHKQTNPESHITLTNRVGQPQSVEHRAWPLLSPDGELIGARQIFCLAQTDRSQTDRDVEGILNNM